MPEGAEADGAFGCCAEAEAPPICAQTLGENAMLTQVIPKAAIIVRKNLLDNQ